MVAEGGALVSVEAEEAEFHELVGVEELVEFVEEGGREAAFAEFEGGFEGLAAAAEGGFLGAGERQVLHGGDVWRAGAEGKGGMAWSRQVMRLFWQVMRRWAGAVCLY